MKEQKGITIASLLIYVVAMGIIISIIAIILSFYSKNISTINDTGDVNLELNKFTTKMIQETQELGNEIIEVTSTTIKFKSGNNYIFKDNRIYQNTIVLSNHVKEFAVTLEREESKQILKIYILLGKGQTEIVKNLSYVIMLNNQSISGLPSYVGSIMPSVDENGLATEPITIQPDPTNNPNLQIVIPTGFAPAILTGSNSTISLPGQDGSVASIMPADQWNNITAEQINQGIVIVDHAITYDGGNATGTVPDFNEYVWVPIPESSSFARTAWITPRTYDGNGNWINGGNTTIEHPLAETSTANYFWEDKTTTEYTNMVNSITTNKGFYIGRYEASNNGRNVAQSKRNQTTWTSVTQTTAITACTNNTTTNTHLMYGIEWDSALKWLIGKATISSATAGQTKTMKIADIQRNSCSWGNYSDSTGDAATNSGGSSAKNTGYSEYWKANNIYDLAGNVWEWTQEKYSTGRCRADRGGGCGSNGGYYPAASRNDNDESYTVYDLRLPCQLLFVALNSGSDACRKVKHQSL